MESGSHSTINTALIAIILAIGIPACSQSATDGQEPAATHAETATITEQEVRDVQNLWGEGIVHIGTIYRDKGDYQQAAMDHINRFYNYQDGVVLFKPTLASEKQFRTDVEGALSYFIGDNENYPEDHGFALKPWSSVRWENTGTKIIGNMAVAMGNYYFTPAKQGDPVKVEYSFAYTKDEEGALRIILHGSHIPYSPD